MRFNAQGKVGVLAGVGGGVGQCHIGKRNLLGAFAAQVFVFDGIQAQMAFGQFIQAMPQMAFHDIGSQHGIAGNAAQGELVIGQNVLVVFEVLADFGRGCGG